MTFIRPEAKAVLWTWRELIAAALLLGFGLWSVFGGYGLEVIFGWACVGVGTVLAVIGAQRLRFRQGAGGPGVVQVVEGQVSYFGPLTGGAVAASEVQRLAVDHTARPAHWVLEQPGQPPLEIPVNAMGSEALFDVFTALPGLKTERVLQGLQDKGPHQVVIWERNPEPVQLHRLH